MGGSIVWFAQDKGKARRFSSRIGWQLHLSWTTRGKGKTAEGTLVNLTRGSSIQILQKESGDLDMKGTVVQHGAQPNESSSRMRTQMQIVIKANQR